MARFNRCVQLDDFGTDVDLTALEDMPLGQPADRVEVTNNESTPQTIVLADSEGTEVPFEVPAQAVRVIDDFEMHGIVASGTETISSVNAYYFDTGGAVNPAP